MYHESQQPWHNGCLINAIQPLIVCGKTLRAEREQSLLVDLLRGIEQKTAWPMAEGIEILEREWLRLRLA